MEMLKDFMTGIVVILLVGILILLSVFLFPLILVAGSLLLLSVKALLFIAFCVFVVILIGYLVRKSFRGSKQA